MAALAVVSCRDDPTRPGPGAASAPVVARLELVSGGGQTQVVHQALPLRVVVRAVTADGSVIRGAKVAFATATDGSFGGVTGLTDAQGLASAVWLLGRIAGEQRGYATLAPMTGVSTPGPLTLQATALAASPAQLDLLVAISADVAPARQVSIRLSARVLDPYGNAVPRIVVRWSPRSLGTLDPDSSVSDARGEVITQWRMQSLTEADIAPDDYFVTARVDDPRIVVPVSATIHRRVVASALVGTWRAVSWEFFSDSGLTARIEDVMEDGMSGTLSVSPADGGFTWHWRERYRWWGPDNGTDVYGRLSIDQTSLLATVDSSVTNLECDWGDCEGPLHGRHDFALDGLRLIVTRAERVGYYHGGGPYPAWSRLTLEKTP